jgi:starch synthase
LSAKYNPRAAMHASWRPRAKSVNMRAMKILLAASELEPFTGAGEFGAAIRALSGELLARGHEVSVVLPYYRTVRENGAAKAKRTGVKFSVQVGGGRFPGLVREMRAPNGVQVFFIERDELFDRSGLYGTPESDYQDNAARFIFFSKCVVELARRMEPSPEIVHAHNWQAALVPVLAAEQRLPARTVLSAHSLAFQGNFWSYDFGLTNLPGEYFSPRGLEYYGSMNLLKAGILYADSVVLPGPRYVSAAQTPAYSCGLDPVLREQAWKLEGITNGLDAAAWNPAADKALPKRYKSAATKGANQKAWLAQTGLTPGSMTLLTAIDAMTEDGLDLLLPALDRLFEADVRVAVLGKAPADQLAAMEFAKRRHAGRFAWLPDYDEATLRLALAGSEAFVCPAPIAPDASILLRALRYGALPVALGCGGLQALAPAWHAAGSGCAFPFYETSVDALVDAVRRALFVRRDTATWQAAVERAMATDFSWSATASATEVLYASVLARQGLQRAA